VKVVVGLNNMVSEVKVRVINHMAHVFPQLVIAAADLSLHIHY
jgi:hypothetical protein